LAAEFGCQVTGIDITAEYCRAAEMLTDKVGLNAQVEFQCGNALDMPFGDAVFDVVWSQNTMMNMEGKARLFKEVHRVLRPGGVFAFEVVLAGQVADPHYPAFWAHSSSLSYLVLAEEMRAMLASAGLRERIWEDTTQRTIVNQRKRKLALVAGATPVLGLGVIVPTELEAKTANGLMNNEEGRTRAVEAVFTK
jgi:ubiquinone/menaquinone biosynthesis C-methylase UbiE